MTWDLLAQTTPAYSPMARLVSEMQDRGGTYTYAAPGESDSRSEQIPYQIEGWSAYKGGITRTSSNAALSALTLLSFLFFLNLLQQQLVSGQQQTLLFMVNNTAPVVGREGSKVRRSFVHTEQDRFGRTVLTVESEREEELSERKGRSRKERDLRRGATRAYRYQPASPAEQHFSNFVEGQSSTAPSPPAPKPIPAPPTVSEPPPVMMEGLQSGSTLQLAAWLRGQLSASELRSDLADTLTNCRAVVACTIYQTSPRESKNAQNEERVRKLLAEAGEYAEPGHLDVACDSLLLSAGSECGTLAQSFSQLLK